MRYTHRSLECYRAEKVPKKFAFSGCKPFITAIHDRCPTHCPLIESCELQFFSQCYYSSLLALLYFTLSISPSSLLFYSLLISPASHFFPVRLIDMIVGHRDCLTEILKLCHTLGKNEVEVTQSLSQCWLFIVLHVDYPHKQM